MLGDNINDLRKWGLIMVDNHWCDSCKWQDVCEYKNFFGLNLSFIVSNEDGSCQKYNSAGFKNLCAEEISFSA
jgi:hypothetical protein